MFELLLIVSTQSQLSYQHITPQNLDKVRQIMRANKKTSEQTITNILKITPQCNKDQSYYKVCSWTERPIGGGYSRAISIEWRKGIFYSISTDSIDGF